MRHRKSKYDEHIDKISEWYAQGVPIAEMVRQLGDGFYEQGVYAFIYARGIKTRTKQMVYASRPQCDTCEFCHEYTNTNNTIGRICAKSWRTIQPNVIHSPVWCEKNEELRIN